MAKLNKVYSFNTGRQYNQHGQPIDWMIVEAPKDEQGPPFHIPYKVFFVDRARHISGVILCMVGNIEDLIHDSWVKNQYDSYQYRDSHQAKQAIDKAMEND